LSQLTSYDAASTIHQTLDFGQPKRKKKNSAAPAAGAGGAGTNGAFGYGLADIVSHIIQRRQYVSSPRFFELNSILGRGYICPCLLSPTACWVVAGNICHVLQHHITHFKPSFIEKHDFL
jgi:hypothetical protein